MMINIDTLEELFGDRYPRKFFFTILEIAADTREQMDESFHESLKREIRNTGNEEAALEKLLSIYYMWYQEIHVTLDEIKNGRILYRGIDVDNCITDEVDINDVGESWSYMKEEAAQFGGCILEGAYPNEINEDFTIKINTIDDIEDEIRLERGSNIQLLRICPFNYEEKSECIDFPTNTRGNVL